MLKPFGKVYFIISLVLYIGVYVLRRTQIELPELFNSYLTDFLCMPVILTLCLVGVRWLKKAPHYRLNAVMIFSMTTFYAVLFEWYLPAQSNAYTADFVDGVLYFTGAFVFWLIWYLESSRIRT